MFHLILFFFLSFFGPEDADHPTKKGVFTTPQEPIYQTTDIGDDDDEELPPNPPGSGG